MTASVYTSDQIDALLQPIAGALAEVQATLQSLQQQIAALAQPPASGPASKESKDGTKIAPGSGSITDAEGDVWTLATSTLIQKNGAGAFNGWQSHESVYHAHAVYILGLDGNWYAWTGAAFSRAAAAPPGA